MEGRSKHFFQLDINIYYYLNSTFLHRVFQQIFENDSLFSKYQNTPYLKRELLESFFSNVVYETGQPVTKGINQTKIMKYITFIEIKIKFDEMKANISEEFIDLQKFLKLFSKSEFSITELKQCFKNESRGADEISMK